MTERTDDVETQNEDETEHEERVYSPDGGVVASTPAASTPTEAGQQLTIGGDPSQEELEPRTKRARTEEMDVSLLQKGGIYEVQSESGNIYEVDVASETCTCPDFSKRDPSGGCKHLRRTDLEIRSGNVPRPDGRLPETMDVVEQLSTEIRELEQEIEERVEQRRKLETTVGVLKEFSIE
ncbi:hypothetical protein [Haloferax volcanii]|uniref:SWIM zinc finger domain protein n=3 Tax=Haloferax volcanii TaxID=2246 RepID=D4GQ93_HALVD|nr:hypothetical protein [Haloferax volcanii]ADE01760.1 SWIM zinc finger domain protein [Haloferax volcanii DS2]MBS8120984.1 hypothetical protein [Haloferax volcanii]MBS8126021.1 hypothetical protein [Haloferax volcanii]MBS8129874.1 hypothetical protein [Haloferax volcanii]MBS8133739.1 hypothetical protein [Haloferax volcanii]